MNTIRAFVCAAISAFLLPTPPARCAESDAQLWTQLQIRHAFDETFAFDLSNRYELHEDMQRLQVVYLNANLSARLPKGFSLGLGYAHSTSRASDGAIVDENVFIQFLQHVLPLGESASMRNRLRVEQRWVEDPVDDPIVRLRYLLGGSWHFRAPWYLTGFGEAWFNANEDDVGPIGGFERSWLRLMVGRRFTSYFRAEMGFHWTYLRRRAPREDVNQLVLMLNFPFDTPTWPGKR